MKFLLVGFDWYGHMTDSLVEAFTANHLEVTRLNFIAPHECPSVWRTILDASRVRKFYNPFYTRINNKISEKSLHKTCLLNEDMIIRELERDSYDYIFIVKGELLLPETLRKIKNRFRVKTIVYFVDHPFIQWENEPVFMKNIARGLKQYDYILSFDSYYIPELKRVSGRPVFLMPLAFSPAFYQPVTGPVDSFYTSDIAFIGANFPPREQILKELRGYDLKVWGYGWDTAVFPSACNRIIPQDEAAKIYTGAGININISAVNSVYGVNTRVFDVLATKNFLLTDYRDDIAQLFTIGTELDVYTDLEDLKKKVEYYLKNEEVRELMAEAGYEKVMQCHQYRHRIEKMVEDITKKF